MTDSTTPENDINTEPSERLRKHCIGCRLAFSWFSTTRKIKDSDKSRMADTVHTDITAFSASKRLMDSRHDAVKKANELRSRIDGYWKGMTVPLAGFGPGGGSKTEPGVRLIRRDQVDEFHRQMASFKAEAQQVEAELNRNLESVKDMDRQRLGDLFDEDDYPERITLSFAWAFPDVDVPKELEQLAPEVYQAEVQAVRQRFEDTVDHALGAFLNELYGVISAWVDRLGPKVRIYPGENHPLRPYYGAELAEKNENADGLLVCKLRYRRKKGERAQDVTLDPMSQEEFSKLHPTEDQTDRKTFKDSTIRNLTDMISYFRNLGSVLEVPDNAQREIDRISEHLAQLGGRPGDIAEELRSSQTFRERTHDLMEEVQQNLEGSVKEVKQGKRQVRRDLVSEKQ